MIDLGRQFSEPFREFRAYGSQAVGAVGADESVQCQSASQRRS